MLLPGFVAPSFDVVSMENRHGPPWMFTQLPPGAPTTISGPRLLKPTLVPAWRSPATPAAPGQFAGESTGPPSLPADTTMSTPRELSALITSSLALSHLPSPPRLMFSTFAG